MLSIYSTKMMKLKLFTMEIKITRDFSSPAQLFKLLTTIGPPENFLSPFTLGKTQKVDELEGSPRDDNVEKTHLYTVASKWIALSCRHSKCKTRVNPSGRGVWKGRAKGEGGGGWKGWVSLSRGRVLKQTALAVHPHPRTPLIKECT